ncbi:BUD22 [Microdochium nivale]|nr:BUD22 [Microdochium nivale]
MAQKRKRPSGEPSLRDKLVGWNKALVRAFKTAKGFERQRLSKRIREAGAAATADQQAKTERLEREVAVLKSIDLHQLAHQHLSSSLLRVKGVAESPNLPHEIKPIPKPESLSEEQRAALHNVTSGLCNRKQVRDVIEEAVMGTCIALRVAMPDKRKGGKSGAAGAKKNDKAGEVEEEEGADERGPAKKNKSDPAAGDKKQKTKAGEADALVLIKRKRQDASGSEHDLEQGTDASVSGGEENDDDDNEDAFEGFSDIEAEERAVAKYDALVGGSSDEDEDNVPLDNNEDEESSEGGDASLDERMIARYDKLLAASSDEETDEQGRGLGSDEEDEPSGTRARAVRRTTADDISLSSGDEDDDLPPGGDDLNREFSGAESSDEAEYDVDGTSDSEEEPNDDENQDEVISGSGSSSDVPASKKTKLSSTAKTKTARSVNTSTGTSAFLPTLMGGYLSNSESEASDLDMAPSLKKNRRGQRARQAIWEKKFGDKAKHFSKPQASQNARDLGWDPRRGAVGGDGDGEPAGPWKQGIRNPFDKRAKDEGMHPERQMAIDRGGNENFGTRDRGQRQAARGGSGGGGSSRDQGSAGRGGGRGHGSGMSRGGRGGPEGGLSRGGGGGGGGGRGRRDAGHSYGSVPAAAPAKPPPPPTKRDDTGPLHPSWAAAKKAKEEAGKIAFLGKKVVFD